MRTDEEKEEQSKETKLWQRKSLQKQEKAARFDARLLALMGVVAAVEIILERLFSISTATNRYSAAFLARMVAAVLFGPVGAGLTCLTADTVGVFLQPFGWNPALSLVALLRGVSYGCFLHRKQTAPRIVAAVLVDQLVISLGLTTTALCVWGGIGFTREFFLARLLQCAVLIPVQLFAAFSLKYILFAKLKRFVYR